MKNLAALILFITFCYPAFSQKKEAADTTKKKEQNTITKKDQDTQVVHITPGASGVKRSIGYKFSLKRGFEDPGNGIFRYNNDNVSDVTIIYVDDIDISGEDQTKWYSTWDDTTGATARGRITIADVDGKVVTVFYFTDVFKDSEGFWILPVEYVSGVLPIDSSVYYYVFDRIAKKEEPVSNNQPAPVIPVNAVLSVTPPVVAPPVTEVIPVTPPVVIPPVTEVIPVTPPVVAPPVTEVVVNPVVPVIAVTTDTVVVPVIPVIEVIPVTPPVVTPPVTEVIPVTPPVVTPPVTEVIPVTPPVVTPPVIEVIPVTPPVAAPPVTEVVVNPVVPVIAVTKDTIIVPVTPVTEVVPVNPVTPVTEVAQPIPVIPVRRVIKADPEKPDSIANPVNQVNPAKRTRPVNSANKDTVVSTTKKVIPAETAKPSATVSQPKPVIADKPLNQAPPSNTVSQPKPANPVTQPKPANPISQPKPAVAEKPVTHEKPAIPVSQPKPSNPVNQTYPAAQGNQSYPVPESNKLPSYQRYTGSSSGISRKWYRGIIEAGYGLGVGDYGLSNFRLNFINGFKIGNSSLGLGIGYRRYFTDNNAAPYLVSKKSEVPVFLDFGTTFSDRKLTPYFALGLGGAASSDTTQSAKDRLFFTTSGGIWYNVSKRFAVFAGVAYELQKLEFSDTNPYTGNYRKNSNSISLNIGIAF